MYAQYLVAYLRVSTSTKDQDPERQLDFIQDWVSLHEFKLVDVVHDIGSSAYKVSPFDRTEFEQAIRLALIHNARGLVIETVDRLSREGVGKYYWTKEELKIRYGLELFLADTPLEYQNNLSGEVVSSIKASLARHEAEQRSRRTSEGMQRKIDVGKKMGQPVKVLSSEHLQEIIRLKDQEGWGYRRISIYISKLRGADDVADRKAQRRRRISHETIRSLYLEAKCEPSN